MNIIKFKVILTTKHVYFQKLFTFATKEEQK